MTDKIQFLRKEYSMIIDSLLDQIRVELKKEAIDTIVDDMVENTDGIWEALKKRCGKREAAIAVNCLLQEAAAENAIVITKFINPNSNDFSKHKGSILAVDEKSTLIEIENISGFIEVSD